MDAQDKILYVLDLLDVDEEVIDSRLKTIMSRKSFTDKHLLNAIYLLNYKNLINLQEGLECENHDECTFAAKLLSDVHEENIDSVCKIVNIVLGLNKSTVVSNSEHMIQQIFAKIDKAENHDSHTIEGQDVDSSKSLLYLALCDSILDAVIRNEKKLSLPFLEVPLENLLASTNDKIKSYFLNNIVPKIFMGVTGYNILDKIWNYVKKIKKENCSNALKILSSLSDFYFPVADKEGNLKFESAIVFHSELWNTLLNGLTSDDPATRKKAIYLLKRAIDSLITLEKDINIISEMSILFNWCHKNMKTFREHWNNFFILIESLEEKQSNIVLPSLQLFDTTKYVNNCWVNCAFKIGLKHDNTQVRLKCIEYRLKTNIESLTDVNILLEALNDINFYDHEKDCEELKSKVAGPLQNEQMVLSVVKVLPYTKWSPVPLFHFSDVFSKLNVDLSHAIEAKQLSVLIFELLKIPCNNIPIKYAIKANITHFVGHCCKNLNWEDYINIYDLLAWDKYSPECLDQNAFIKAIKNLDLDPKEKDDFFQAICKTNKNIGIGLLYLKNHTDDLFSFMNYVDKKIKNIRDINNRQYSCKKDCFSDIVYVTHLFKSTWREEKFMNTVANIISGEYYAISSYIFSLVQESDVTLSVEEINLLLEGFESMAVVKDDKVKEVILGMYRHMIIILTNKNENLQKKLCAISIIKTITKQFYASDKNRFFSLKQILHVLQHVDIRDITNIVDAGRSRNAFYEKSSEVIYIYLQPDEYREIPEDFNEPIEEIIPDDINESLKELVDYIKNIAECGGYGSLKWILKIMNEILESESDLLNNNNVEFDIAEFIEKMWREIEGLKSNNLYDYCIQEFARLILQKSLLKKPEYSNIIQLYCTKMVEYGSSKISAFYHFVVEFNNIFIDEHVLQIFHILCDILLFSPVPKKDHRIADNLFIQIEARYFPSGEFESCYYNSIQWLARNTLCSINNTKSLEKIAALIIDRLENYYRTKQRYHGNSLIHRSILIGLQHLLLISIRDQRILESKENVDWVLEFLGKLPHQPSVKVCLEWYISLHFYLKDIQLDQNVVDVMKSKNVPLTSQFIILFWTLKHKIFVEAHDQEEFEYVMDFLLCHTMGQMFNVRLQAQYLASELFKENESTKYAYIIEVIQKTFIESCKDKNFVRLKQDFFVNNFDIVAHYTPLFIYYFLPRYYEIGINEKVEMRLEKMNCFSISGIHLFPVKTDFLKEIFELRVTNEDILKYDLPYVIESNKSLETSDMMGTIQKKYIPWKNMSDIDIYDNVKWKETKGELIVVASLIDKLPNLGGMARTCEVFGVNTYVVDSLRHLQDKTFQGLSVSAERWVNIEEVRPGPPLKDYLFKKKAEGYSIVAAEQTSTSVSLHQFKFPKKTLLLLGHEKEGIPCDLLPIMDSCVEIPQQGFVRSLNVHVTAAIFIWEYSRQNVL